MILLDTSLWVALVRQKGDPRAKARTADLLERGEAAWCDVVRLELWRGIGSTTDRDHLTDLESEVPVLTIDDPVWTISCKLAAYARLNGWQFPTADLIVFACASRHGVEVEARDKHFQQLARVAAELNLDRG